MPTRQLRTGTPRITPPRSTQLLHGTTELDAAGPIPTPSPTASGAARPPARGPRPAASVSRPSRLALNTLSDTLLAVSNSVQPTDPSASSPAYSHGLCDRAGFAQPISPPRSARQANPPATPSAARSRQPMSDRPDPAPLSLAWRMSGASATTSKRSRAAPTTSSSPPPLASRRHTGRNGRPAPRRDRRHLAALDDLPRTPLSSVVRVLERTSAAIVITPPSRDPARRAGVTSIRLTSIYPPPRRRGVRSGLRMDLRARVEELLAAADLTAGAPTLHRCVRAWLARGLPRNTRWCSRSWSAALQGSTSQSGPRGSTPTPPRLQGPRPDRQAPHRVHIIFSMVPDADSGTRMSKLIATTNRLITEASGCLLCRLPRPCNLSGRLIRWREAAVRWASHLDSGRPLLGENRPSRASGQRISP